MQIGVPQAPGTPRFLRRMTAYHDLPRLMRRRVVELLPEEHEFRVLIHPKTAKRRDTECISDRNRFSVISHWMARSSARRRPLRRAAKPDLLILPRAGCGGHRRSVFGADKPLCYEHLRLARQFMPAIVSLPALRYIPRHLLVFRPTSCHFAVKRNCRIPIPLHIELHGNGNCPFGVGVFGRRVHDNIGPGRMTSQRIAPTGPKSATSNSTRPPE